MGGIRRLDGGWQARYGVGRVMGPMFRGERRETFEQAEQDLNLFFAGYLPPTRGLKRRIRK
jgi:hypothetical protein